MRCVVVIVLILGLESAQAADKAATPDFSAYPQTEAFKTYLYVQTNETWNLSRSNLLSVSTFPDGGRTATRCSVTESGQQGDFATVTVNSSTNAVDAYRRFGFEPAEDVVVDSAGVRFLPMSRELASGGF
jgi:hypothetical protein